MSPSFNPTYTHTPQLPKGRMLAGKHSSRIIHISPERIRDQLSIPLVWLLFRSSFKDVLPFHLGCLVTLQGVLSFGVLSELSFALCHPGILSILQTHKIGFSASIFKVSLLHGLQWELHKLQPHQTPSCSPPPGPLPPSAPLNLEKFPRFVAPSLYRSHVRDHEPPCVPSLGRRTQPG